MHALLCQYDQVTIQVATPIAPRASKTSSMPRELTWHLLAAFADHECRWPGPGRPRGIQHRSLLRLDRRIIHERRSEVWLGLCACRRGPGAHGQGLRVDAGAMVSMSSDLTIEPAPRAECSRRSAARCSAGNRFSRTSFAPAPRVGRSRSRRPCPVTSQCWS